MEQQAYSVRAYAGGMPVACFMTAHSFFEGGGAQPAFSEDHVHACFELLFCKRGEGFQFIEGKAYPYAAGSIFVLKPFVTHAHIASPRTADEQSGHAHIASPRTADEQSGHAHIANPRTAEAPSELRYSVRFFFPEGQEAAGEPLALAALKRLQQDGFFHFVAAPPLPGILDALAESVRSEPPAARLVLSGLLSALFSYVLREICVTFGEGQASPPAEDNPNLRRFLIDDFFNQLIDSNARMEELCKRVHLSPSQLNRVIRELYGTSFKQRMIDVRLAYIQYFLKYSELPVREIAERTGFLEDSNLSLFFKQHCGMSPTRYRQESRAVPADGSAPGEGE